MDKCLLLGTYEIRPGRSDVINQRHRLRGNLMGAWILARLPFLFVPWIDSIWYLIFSCAVYELFNKSGIPALIEILKTNITKGERENTLTLCFVLTFLESIILGLFIAGALDKFPAAWQWICGLTACLSLSSLFAQVSIPMRHSRCRGNAKLFITMAFSYRQYNPIMAV